MRKIVIASHERMAEGIKKTLDFITNNGFDINAISAYTDETPLTTEISSLFSQFDDKDEVVILTDMISGSVNQAFVPYINDHVFLLTGINLPLALEIVLYPQDQPLCEKVLNQLVENASKQILNISYNQKDMEGDE